MTLLYHSFLIKSGPCMSICVSLILLCKRVGSQGFVLGKMSGNVIKNDKTQHNVIFKHLTDTIVSSYFCPLVIIIARLPSGRRYCFCLRLSVCLFVCLFVHLLPKYLKNCWTYFDFLLQEKSLIQGKEMIKFWSRSDSRLPTDHNGYTKPFLGNKFGVFKDIDLQISVLVDCT